MEAEKKKLGPMLIIGILLLPFMFAWVTLKDEYRVQTRVASIIWMVFVIFALLSTPNPKNEIDTSGVKVESEYLAPDTVESNQDNPDKVSSNIENAKPADKPEPEPAYEIVNINQIAADYSSNEARGDKLYKGKTLLIEGLVDNIDKDMFDDTVVSLNIENNFLPASMTLIDDDKNEEKAIMLDKGQKVQLLCLSTGEIMGSPTFKDCRFP